MGLDYEYVLCVLFVFMIAISFATSLTLSLFPCSIISPLHFVSLPFSSPLSHYLSLSASLSPGSLSWLSLLSPSLSPGSLSPSLHHFLLSIHLCLCIDSFFFSSSSLPNFLLLSPLSPPPFIPLSAHL